MRVRVDPASAVTWRWLLAAAIVFYVAATLPILTHVLTWEDPGWWSYLAFDIYNGRPLVSNQDVDLITSPERQGSFAFFTDDLRASLVWCYLVALSFLLPFDYLLCAELLTLCSSVGFVLMTYLIARKVLEDEIRAIQAALVCLLDYSVFWMATMARPDMTAALLAYAGVYFYLKSEDERKLQWGILALLVWSLAIGTHILSSLIVIAFLTVFAISLAVKHSNELGQALRPLTKLLTTGAVFIAITMSWYFSFVPRELKEDLSESHFLHSAGAYFKEAVFDAYSARYIVHLLAVITVAIVVSFVLAVRTHRYRMLPVLGFLAVLAVCLVQFDVSYAKERLLYYVPAVSVILVDDGHLLWRRFRSKIVPILVFAFVLLSALLPRAGKYYQILRNWEGTDYSAYSSWLTAHLPPGATIIGDISMFWGLHDHGVLLLQDVHVRFSGNHEEAFFGREHLEEVDYLVVEPEGMPEWFTWAEFRMIYDYPIEEVASFKSKPGYGYHKRIFRRVRETGEALQLPSRGGLGHTR